MPLVQLEVQQSEPLVHAPRAGVHTTVQALLAGSQCPEQQSVSAVHDAFCPRHAPGGRMHRPSGPHRSFLSVAPQQPDCGPLPQSSPVGRQVELAVSTSHILVDGSHTPEQQSAFTAHESPMMVHSVSAQTPPKQPSEQQSCAVAHATPFARQASRHWTTPAWPVTGSQRPLQHEGLVVQLALGARQAPPDVVVPPSLPAPPAPPLPLTKPPLWHVAAVHVPEQQSNPCEHAAPADAHDAVAGPLPGPVPGALVPVLASSLPEIRNGAPSCVPPASTPPVVSGTLAVLPPQLALLPPTTVHNTTVAIPQIRDVRMPSPDATAFAPATKKSIQKIAAEGRRFSSPFAAAPPLSS